MARPQVEPILEADLDEFAAFVFEHLGGDSPAMWRGVFSRGWCAERPNYGYMLRMDGRIVGVIGGIYATRMVRGRAETFCNISCWMVLPEFRKHSFRLATALVGQDNYHFTDFTPTRIVAESLRFLKFERISSRLVELVNIPWVGFWFSRSRVVDDPDLMRDLLQGVERKALEDHLKLPWLRHAVIENGGKATYVLYKVIRLTRFRCAMILGVSDREEFSRNELVFRSYLAGKEGVAFTRIERRFLEGPLCLGKNIKRAPRKLFRSATLAESDIDNLYSELVGVDLPAQYY